MKLFGVIAFVAGTVLATSAITISPLETRWQQLLLGACCLGVSWKLLSVEDKR